MQGASAEHQWVLCVDDDVLLYETFLEDLIRSMQQRPSFFMATGPHITALRAYHCATLNLAHSMVQPAHRTIWCYLQGIHLTSQAKMPASSHTAAWHTTCRSLLLLLCVSTPVLCGAGACSCPLLTCALTATASWLPGIR